MSMEQVPLLILEVRSLHPQLIYIALDEEERGCFNNYVMHRR